MLKGEIFLPWILLLFVADVCRTTLVVVEAFVVQKIHLTKFISKSVPDNRDVPLLVSTRLSLWTL